MPQLTFKEDGVTAPRGFLACGLHVGLKKHKKDLALIYSEAPCSVAGVFTTNRVKAAPLKVTMPRVAAGRAQAVIVNSGNANACNGPAGEEDARLMGRLAAEALGLPEEMVLVSSTGVIGQRLPVERIAAGLPEAVRLLGPNGGDAAAEAIMTTDLVPKKASVTIDVGGRPVTIGGMAKGSGMIHPNMATMLAFITTDAAIGPAALKEALKAAVDRSFHMISIDGDTSTNDMAVVMANGLAGNAPLEPGQPEFALFCEALTGVCVRLAKKIARDGEGATTLIEVRVRGARTEADARLAARAIAASNLVKAAVFGRDANWGRIICAAGYSGAGFDPERFAVWLGDLQVAADGRGLDFDEARATEILSGDPVIITVDLGQGDGEAAAWGCDLSYDYVKINAAYRT